MKNMFIDSATLDWTELGGGLRRKILGYDDHLMMVCVDFQKNAIGALHSHEHRQVTYIVKGIFEVTIGGEKKILREGDSFFVPPNIQHGVVALEEGRLIDVFTPARTDFLNEQSKG